VLFGVVLESEREICEIDVLRVEHLGSSQIVCADKADPNGVRGRAGGFSSPAVKHLADDG
jgi:hypothetical protein